MIDSVQPALFIARQPILDAKQHIFGYELLFRTSWENKFDVSLDQDYTTTKILLDAFLVFDIKDLTKGKRMFINFTSNVLLSEVALSYPKEILVVELLEDILPVPEIISSCQNLRKNGYMIALDDFQFAEKYLPLIELADIVKIDFLKTQGLERKNIITWINDPRIKFLAEKIETIEDFNLALNYGYAYFQGYFFSKPVIVSSRDVPSNKITHLQLLKELNQEDIDSNRVESIIKRDVSITYKLLRFINSAAFSFLGEIHSIRQALNLIGLNEFKKWISMIALSQIGSDKPEELVTSSIIRAKFCELIAEQTSLKNRRSDIFLMGLFSFIDAFLGRPMSEILINLPLPGDIKEALLGNDNPFKEILDFVRHHERGEWEEVTRLSASLKLDNARILQSYLMAINWANNYQQII